VSTDAELLPDGGHEHVFLGSGHTTNERKAWAVIALCSAMMLIEIGGGMLFGSRLSPGVFGTQTRPPSPRADSDISRGAHQQQVMQAALSKLASFGTFLRLPFSGADLMKPLSTDLSALQFLELGWVKFRAGSTLHCRLGGRSLGDGFITGDQENIAVIQMVLGNSAPQPPPPAAGPYGPGCFIGNQGF